jgi:hypothetical protein
MAIDSEGMDLNTLWQLMDWANSESKERNMSMRDILEDVRTAIDEAVLQDDD